MNETGTKIVVLGTTPSLKTLDTDKYCSKLSVTANVGLKSFRQLTYLIWILQMTCLNSFIVLFFLLIQRTEIISYSNETNKETWNSRRTRKPRRSWGAWWARKSRWSGRPRWSGWPRWTGWSRWPRRANNT